MKAVIFSRVSSTTDRQNTERQIKDLQTYANANNIEVVKQYSEHISGATKNKDRAVLNECLEYVKNNDIDIILFSELSRLGRNVLEVLELVKLMADNKINAYFQKENLTLLNEKNEVSPITTIYISCLGMVAEYERENIKFRLNSGRKIAIENGKKMGRKEGTTLSKADREKKYSKVIKMLRNGLTIKQILTICKAENIKVGEATLWKLKKEFCKGEN